MSLTFLIQVRLVCPEKFSLFFALSLIAHWQRVKNSLLIHHTVCSKGVAEHIVNSVHKLLITNMNMSLAISYWDSSQVPEKLPRLRFWDKADESKRMEQRKNCAHLWLLIVLCVKKSLPISVRFCIQLFILNSCCVFVGLFRVSGSSRS